MQRMLYRQNVSCHFEFNRVDLSLTVISLLHAALLARNMKY